MDIPLAPGDILAGHRILDVLGQGATSIVYLVEAPDGQQYALKVFTVDLQTAAKLARRFTQEGEIIASICHENVIRFFDAGSDGQRVWLRLELVRGRSLRAKMGEFHGMVPHADAVRWMIGVCEGVAAAHAAGVVHRDLKPSNILITDAGGVKVIDFGLAKLLERWGVQTTHDTQLGAAMYMAPEQAQGAQADRLMDMFALGTILHELLAGVHPFGRPMSVFAIVRWHLENTARPLREVAPTVPHDLAALVDRAMEKDPARRLQSMRELADALRAALAHMNAPLRRAARNALPSNDLALARTLEMAASSDASPVSESARPTVPASHTAARGTIILPRAPAAMPERARDVLPPPEPTPPAGERVAVLPIAVPIPVPVVKLVIPALPERATLPSAAAPIERRSTSAPVESSIAPAARSKARPALAIAAGLVLAAGAAAVVGYQSTFVGGPAPVARAPAAAPPPDSGVASASASTKPPEAPAAPKPARPPTRRTGPRDR